MVVDDRIAIIGSANINERSQRGDRDSELACVIRDTDMVDSTMAGKPYKVGRFAHTLRIRLMREHLGVDVDALEEEEAHMDLMEREPVIPDEDDVDVWDPSKEEHAGKGGITGEKGHRTRANEEGHRLGGRFGEVAKGAGEAVGIAAQKGMPNIDAGAASAADNAGHKAKKSAHHSTETEDGPSTGGDRIVTGGEDGDGTASTVVPTLEEKTLGEGRPQNGKQDGMHASGTRSEGKSSGRSGPQQGRLVDDLKQAGAGSSTSGQASGQPDANHNVSDTRQLAGKGDTGQELREPEDVAHAHRGGGHHDNLHDLEEHEERAKAQRPTDEKERKKDKAEEKIRKRHSRLNSNVTVASFGSTSPTMVREESEAGNKTAGGKSNEQIANSNRAVDAARKGLQGKMNAYSLPTQAPKVDPKMFDDPLTDSFYKDVWVAGEIQTLTLIGEDHRLSLLFSNISGRTKYSDLQKSFPMHAGRSRHHLGHDEGVVGLG